MRKILATLGFSAFICLFIVSGCSPKPGKSCSSNDKPTCLDAATLLECKDGVWLASGCLGPKGCESNEKEYACDTSLAKAGDVCTKESRYSCSTDKKAQLRCKAGKWTTMAQCTKEPGCNVGSFLNSCPGAVANEGDECDMGTDPKKKSYLCTTDKKSALLCKDGKWKAIEQCLGKDGCGSSMFSIKCDGPTAKVGDDCDFEDKPDYACSADGKAQLICKANGWALDKNCRGKEGCTTSVLGIKCDASVMEPGEACAKDGSAACSTDGKTILECKGGKFEKVKECPKSCSVGFATISCE